MLTSDDLGHVLEEVLDVSAQWYTLGRQLKVRSGTLDSIQAQSSDPELQLQEMLKTWLTTSDNPSWKTLTDALRSQSIGGGQLAGLLEKKYCTLRKTEGDGGMSASDSNPETYVTPPPELMVDLSTSLPGETHAQDLESFSFNNNLESKFSIM